MYNKKLIGFWKFVTTVPINENWTFPNFFDGTFSREILPYKLDVFSSKAT